MAKSLEFARIPACRARAGAFRPGPLPSQSIASGERRTHETLVGHLLCRRHAGMKRVA